MQFLQLYLERWAEAIVPIYVHVIVSNHEDVFVTSVVLTQSRYNQTVWGHSVLFHGPQNLIEEGQFQPRSGTCNRAWLEGNTIVLGYRRPKIFSKADGWKATMGRCTSVGYDSEAHLKALIVVRDLNRTFTRAPWNNIALYYTAGFGSKTFCLRILDSVWRGPKKLRNVVGNGSTVTRRQIVSGMP